MTVRVYRLSKEASHMYCYRWRLLMKLQVALPVNLPSYISIQIPWFEDLARRPHRTQFIWATSTGRCLLSSAWFESICWSSKTIYMYHESIIFQNCLFIISKRMLELLNKDDFSESLPTIPRTIRHPLYSIIFLC